MKIFRLTSTKQIKVLAIAAMLTGLFGTKSYAQVIRSKAPGDTLTYMLYNSDLNFDPMRTRVFEDKATVDSMVNVLAAKENKQYQIIYRKEGQQGKTVTARNLRMMDRSGVFRIMITYNKPGFGDDVHPMYILSSK
ncbi:hypothetical protein HQ865_23145 [Mucilaginibacter mali]|uniref:Uncharacterized protein n=1 Tax=Mucilaginibacter mali TaxID=2740462 RepID=A0A7D4TS46_9SPHI|nr:hypothetical protein [Mucilaginibacter mali]QKJ32534.1 hypothetical protein HQ865_23145 [Mucilaginibacter mali]